jgi:hypothetical protein
MSGQAESGDIPYIRPDGSRSRDEFVSAIHWTDPDFGEAIIRKGHVV